MRRKWLKLRHEMFFHLTTFLYPTIFSPFKGFIHSSFAKEYGDMRDEIRKGNKQQHSASIWFAVFSSLSQRLPCKEWAIIFWIWILCTVWTWENYIHISYKEKLNAKLNHFIQQTTFLFRLLARVMWMVLVARNLMMRIEDEREMFCERGWKK